MNKQQEEHIFDTLSIVDKFKHLNDTVLQKAYHVVIRDKDYEMMLKVCGDLNTLPMPPSELLSLYNQQLRYENDRRHMLDPDPRGITCWVCMDKGFVPYLLKDKLGIPYQVSVAYCDKCPMGADYNHDSRHDSPPLNSFTRAASEIYDTEGLAEMNRKAKQEGKAVDKEEIMRKVGLYVKR